MLDGLRENPDGSVSLIRRGREVLRGTPPIGAGIDGFRAAFDMTPAQAVAQLQRLAPYIARAAQLDDFVVTPHGAHAVRVEVTWPGGTLARVYQLRDLPRLCRLRRAILADVLEARA